MEKDQMKREHDSDIRKEKEIAERNVIIIIIIIIFIIINIIIIVIIVINIIIIKRFLK